MFACFQKHNSDSRICHECLVLGLWILAGYSSNQMLMCGKVGCLNRGLRRIVWVKCVLKWPCCNAAKLIFSSVLFLLFFFFSVIKRLARNYFVCLFCLAHSFVSLLFFFLALIFFFFPSSSRFVYCIPAANGFTHLW